MLEVAAPPSDAGLQPVVQPAPVAHHVSFHEVLSALNPLQYLPVIGTIYRAVTGDQIPEAVRRVGSLVVSGVLGGPIGAAINLAIMVAEKITGIDLDRTGQTLLTGNAPAGHPADDPSPTEAPAPVPVARSEAPDPPPASPPVQPWSPTQLAAYGVSSTGDGVLQRAGRSGADVLNALELLRIQGARVAYGRAQDLAA